MSCATWSTAPLSGSSLSSTPPLPTSHIAPSADGARPCTYAFGGEPGSSARRGSTEKRVQSGCRYHKPLSLLANHTPPSRSSYADDHDGRIMPCAYWL